MPAFCISIIITSAMLNEVLNNHGLVIAFLNYLLFSLQELKDLYLPLLHDIFGYGNARGWGLNIYDPKLYPYEFNAIYNFLAPNGCLFKVIDKLMTDPDAMFQFPSASLPVSTDTVFEFLSVSLLVCVDATLGSFCKRWWSCAHIINENKHKTEITNYTNLFFQLICHSILLREKLFQLQSMLSISC